MFSISLCLSATSDLIYFQLDPVSGSEKIIDLDYRSVHGMHMYTLYLLLDPSYSILSLPPSPPYCQLTIYRKKGTQRRFSKLP